MDHEQAPVLNKSALLERVGGDLELLQEIAGLFQQDCPQLLSQIRAAVDQADATALERAAHTLKGCVGNFGAEAAFAAALHLERLGRVRQLEGAAAACHNLEAEVARFQGALQALARELSEG